LTIDDRFGWTGEALSMDSDPLTQAIMNLDPGAIFTPVAKVGVDGLPSWEVSRQCPPTAALAQQIENGIEDGK
jgi:hypothetical protein